MIAKMPKNSKNRKLRGYLYVMIGSMHMEAKITHSSTKTALIDWVVKEPGVEHTLLKRGQISYATNTKLSMLIFNKKSSWTASKKPSNFGYYIKTENYEAFIPKIAREVYNLEHRKLRKRKLRGRKLRGHSVPDEVRLGDSWHSI